eukprot:scaffold1023_cov292-Prasinococcus_capsulatus_cf.AAC.5
MRYEGRRGAPVGLHGDLIELLDALEEALVAQLQRGALRDGVLAAGEGRPGDVEGGLSDVRQRAHEERHRELAVVRVLHHLVQRREALAAQLLDLVHVLLKAQARLHERRPEDGLPQLLLLRGGRRGARLRL